MVRGSVPDSPFAFRDNDTTWLAAPNTAQVTPVHAVRHGSDTLVVDNDVHPDAENHADALLVLV